MSRDVQRVNVQQSNNDKKKYGWQTFFLFISLCLLLKNDKEFTFISLFLFTAPVWIDISSTSFEGSIFKVVRFFYLMLNSLISLISVLGMFGVLLDTGSAFAIPPDAMLGAGIMLTKKKFVIPLLLDIAVPAILKEASSSEQLEAYTAPVPMERQVGYDI